MKTNKKRSLVSLAIILVFLLSCLPLAALANNTDKETTVSVEQTQTNTQTTTQTTNKTTEETNKTKESTESTIIKEDKENKKAASFDFNSFNLENSEENNDKDLARSPRAISPALTHFQWGSAPSAKGAVKNAQVKNVGGKFAYGTLPAGTSDEYVTVKFDARTLGGSENKPLTNYMGFEDGYLGVSGYGGGQGKVFIDNQSDNDYEIVGMEFDPTANNLMDNVNLTWTTKMFEEIKTNPRFDTFYQKYKADLDNNITPSNDRILELHGMYTQDGVDGYDLLIGDTYTVNGVFDIETASKEIFSSKASVSGVYSDGGHLFYDVARYRMEAMTFAQIGTETSDYISGRAQYSVAKYTTRTAEAQQGILDQIPNKEVTKEGVYELPIHIDSSASMTNNSFNNWYIRADVAFQVVLKRVPKPTAKLTYHGNTNNSGTAPVDNNDYNLNDEANVLGEGDLKKVGYRFYAWNTKEDGSGEQYNVNDKIVMSKNIDLYAQWEQEKYKITYNGNGNTSGSAPVDGQDYLHASNATVASAGNLARDGYSFVNWNTRADGSGIAYAPNASITMVQHNTLYAQWRANEVPVSRFTLNYLGNGNTSGTVPSGGTYDAGSRVAIAGAGNMAREGFRFVNWNTEANGSGQAYDVNSAVTLNSNITLYAQWAENVVPVEPPVTPTPPTPTPAAPVIPGAPATPPRLFMDSILEDAAAAPDVEENLEEAIDDGQTPLAGKEKVWALVNLILTVVGMIWAAVLFVGIFINKKKTEQTEKYDAEQKTQTIEEEQSKKSKSMLWRVLAIITAIVSLIVFIITEDMSLPMVMSDKWTLLMVVLLAFEGLFTAIMYITRNNKKDNNIEKEDAQLLHE